jgi:hypothetical protein
LPSSSPASTNPIEIARITFQALFKSCKRWHHLTVDSEFKPGKL